MTTNSTQRKMDFIVSCILGEDHDCKMRIKGFCEVCEEQISLEAEAFLRQEAENEIMEDTTSMEEKAEAWENFRPSPEDVFGKGEISDYNNPPIK